MDADLQKAIGAALDTTVARARPLSGGDINQAYAITLADGRELFAKTNRRPAAGMFPAEARGLAWLDEANAIRVPRVIVAVDGFLILELVREGQPGPSFDEDLGRALANLHGARPAGFGLDHDNYIGRLPQSNHPAGRWSDFYRDERLAPQARRATDAGLLPARLRGRLDRVLTGLDGLIGPAEPPARLHGDLWGGNLMCDDRGKPCLIDPAVYGGHREVDLAMMRLFGGFGQRTFDAYDEAFPLAEGHGGRVPLYQLYFLLVHVNLFGGSYVGSVESALSALV
jgi:fructosamine-3-kinase